MATGLIGFSDKDVPNSSLRDMVRIIFRRKKLFVLFFLAVMVVVSAITFLFPKIYRSEASLLVKLGRESVMIDPTAAIGRMANVRQERSNEINSELAVLRSRDLFETVVNQTGVEIFQTDDGMPGGTEISAVEKIQRWIKGMKSELTERFMHFLKIEAESEAVRKQMERENIIRGLMENFAAQAVPESNVITLSYDSESPETAHKILQKIISTYLDKHMAVHRTSGSYEFFEEQSNKVKENIEYAGKSLNDIKNQTGIASFEKQGTLLLERIDSLMRDLQETESSMAANEKQVEALRKKLVNVPKTTVQASTTGRPLDAIEDLKKKVYDLKLEEQRVLSKFAEQSVPAKDIRREIKVAEGLLAKAVGSQEITTGSNATYQQLEMSALIEEANFLALKAKAQKLRTQLSQAQEELKKINDHELQIKDLERELEIGEASYRKYADGKEQSRIDNALELGKISNISIAQSCTIPVEPIRPKKGLNLLGGLFLALAGGIGVVFFREYLDHTYTIPEDIEKRLGIPSLGSVPMLDRMALKELSLGNGGTRYYLPSENVRKLSTGQVSENQPLVLQEDSSATVSHQNKPARIIAVTSSRKGEGASTVSLYLASILSHDLEGRVLLVDGNFQDPAIHKILGGRLSPGLGEMLSQRNFDMKMLQPTGQKGFDFIAAGEKRPPHLRWSERETLAELLHSLRQRYDFVIVDTPSLWNGAGSGTPSFDALVDGVVLVIEAEKTRWEVTQSARDRLLKMNANILGAVLNKQIYHIPKWLYRRF